MQNFILSVFSQEFLDFSLWGKGLRILVKIVIDTLMAHSIIEFIKRYICNKFNNAM